MSLKLNRPNRKNFDKPLTINYQYEFSNFLSEHGLEPEPNKGLLTDGSIGRAYINVGGKRKLTGWYQLWLDQSVPYGRFGDYRTSADVPTHHWKPENKKNKTISKEEKAEIANLRKEAEIKQTKKHQETAKKAKDLWDKATPCEKHPYLETKNALSYGLRVNTSNQLVIPLYDKTMTIVGLQYIDEHGKKLFLTGSKKSGSFFILGQEVLKTSKVINYAEGSS